jgi:hypothetical protein
MYNGSMNYNTSRQQLIEVASLRPKDIKDFFEKYIVIINDCFFLNKDAPEYLDVLYRGKVKQFKASHVPMLLAGVPFESRHTCGIRGCINPHHMA